MEGFDVGLVYPLRTYERYQFSFSIDGKEYKGEYHDGIIDWLNPYPKQDVGPEQLEQTEAEVYQMLGHHGVNDKTDHIEVERMLDKAHSQADAHRFKLTEQGEEFKGIIRDDNIECVHPKPRNKLEPDVCSELERYTKRWKSIKIKKANPETLRRIPHDIKRTQGDPVYRG